MIAPRLQRQITDPFRKRINRAPSPVLATVIPWLSILLASLSPTWPIIASAPVLPPLGFIMMVSWSQLRPGLLPAWAGLPLGLFDDLYNGQPFGSAMLLWSLARLLLEYIELKVPWRGFPVDWLIAAAIITGYLLLSLGTANAAGASTGVLVIAPQLVLSLLLFPLVGRLVAQLDRFRLLPIMAID